MRLSRLSPGRGPGMRRTTDLGVRGCLGSRSGPRPRGISCATLSAMTTTREVPPSLRPGHPGPAIERLGRVEVHHRRAHQYRRRRPVLLRSRPAAEVAATVDGKDAGTVSSGRCLPSPHDHESPGSGARTSSGIWVSRSGVTDPGVWQFVESGHVNGRLHWVGGPRGPTRSAAGSGSIPCTRAGTALPSSWG